jgi:nuclear pore complex protein Nup107
MKDELRELLEDVTTTIEPLLHGFLTSFDEQEDADYYTIIRRVYVPPTILAYTSFRTFASTLLGPENILPSLELATLLALDQNAELADDFVKSGLMEAFVKSMAASSRILIRLNQEREVDDAAKKRSKKKKAQKSRFWVGESVDVWDPTKIN